MFRARSRGGEGGGPGQGEPERGIYMRNLAEQGPLYMVFRRSGTVPQPNNTTTGQRQGSARVVQRVPVGAAHRRRFRHDRDARPVDAGVDLSCCDGRRQRPRTGTLGVYTSSSHGMPTTGASMLGDVYGRRVESSRPSRTSRCRCTAPCRPVLASTSSRARPRSRSATTIVFKGNFAVGGRRQDGRLLPRHRRQGRHRADRADRKFLHEDSGIADRSARTFGSTAPPSAGGKYAVFAGYDNEQAADERRHLSRAPRQEADRARDRGEDRRSGARRTQGQKFERVRRGDVGVVQRAHTSLFWGGWGGERDVTLVCPDEGNAAMRGDACYEDETEPRTRWGKCRSTRASSCATCRARNDDSSIVKTGD